MLPYVVDVEEFNRFDIHLSDTGAARILDQGLQRGNNGIRLNFGGGSSGCRASSNHGKRRSNHNRARILGSFYLRQT